MPREIIQGDIEVAQTLLSAQRDSAQITAALVYRGLDEQTATANLQPPLPGLDKIVKPFRFAPSPYVYKVVPLREARTPDQMTLCDTPEAAAAYWRLHVPHAEAFDPECECFTVLLLNSRRRIKAHHLGCRQLYFVDNVATSGNTIRAVYAAMNRGAGLVFADAGGHTANHPEPALL